MDSMSPLGGAGAGFDASKLSSQDKKELEQFIMAESQRSRIQSTIHGLTDTCFRKCVPTKISGSQLDRSEEPCINNCVARFMDANGVILKQLEKIRTAGQ